MSMNQKIHISDYFIIGLLYLFAFFSFQEDVHVILLYTVVPLCFLFSYANAVRVPVNNTVKGIIVLYLWFLVTLISALDYKLAFDELKMCLGVLLMIMIIQRTARNTAVLPWLYGIWIVYYYALCAYALHLFLSGQFLFGRDRIVGEGFNPNDLGYYTFFLTFIIFVLPQLISSVFFKKFLRFLFLLLLPWSFFISIATGSRQIIIIQIPLILSFIYIRYFFKTNIKKKVQFLTVFLLLAGVATIVYFDDVKDIYMNSALHTRSELSLDDDERTVLINDAIEVGIKNPVFGIGPGNYQKVSILKLYSHNTYTELFANSGVFGVIIYLSIVCLFIAKQTKRYRRTKDPFFVSFSLFGLFYLLDSVFIIIYRDIYLFSFFVLVVCHSELYYQSCYITSLAGQIHKSFSKLEKLAP